MPTAILIDGAYFIKRFRAIEPHNAHNADRAAACTIKPGMITALLSGKTTLSALGPEDVMPGVRQKRGGTCALV